MRGIKPHLPYYYSERKKNVKKKTSFCNNFPASDAKRQAHGSKTGIVLFVIAYRTVRSAASLVTVPAAFDTRQR